MPGASGGGGSGIAARVRPLTSAQLRGRTERAYALWLAKRRQFHELWNRNVSVPSQTHDNVAYVVRVDARGDAAAGECPDWQFRRPPGGCKHMRAVQMFFLRGTRAQRRGARAPRLRARRANLRL